MYNTFSLEFSLKMLIVSGDSEEEIEVVSNEKLDSLRHREAIQRSQEG